MSDEITGFVAALKGERSPQWWERVRRPILVDQIRAAKEDEAWLTSRSFEEYCERVEDILNAPGAA